jgi:hypothetical protein
MADNPTSPDPKRRWYQFRLRTVLIGVAILSIPLIYAGRQAQNVRVRKAMIETIQDAGGSVYPFASVGLFSDGPALWCRKLFGDPGYGLVNLPPAMSTRASAVQKLFPETTVVILRSSANPIEKLFPDRIVFPVQ